MFNLPLTKIAGMAKSQVDRRHLLIALYIVVAFLYWAALYLYVPTLPSYVASKSNSLALVGLVLSMYGLWQAIIRLPLGVAADWLGWRKPFILVGLCLVGLGAWVMGSARGTSELLVGRAITGLAAGTWVPLVVVFSDLFPANEAVRATAVLTLVSSIARMLATAVTGSLNQVGGYPLAFFVAAGTAALALLIVLPTHEKPRPRQRPSLAGVGTLVSRQDVLLPSLLSAISQYANWAATFGFLPILAQQLGATDIVQSMLVSMNIGVVIVGNTLATGIANRVGARRLVYISFFLLSMGLGCAALATSLLLLFVAQFFIGLSMGIAYPVLMGMSIRHIGDAERTTAMGFYQAVYAVGMFGGPWISGWLADGLGIQTMFGITAFFCLAAGLLMNHWLASKL
jgi:MFS family permease